jgi:hypothetical protein
MPERKKSTQHGVMDFKDEKPHYLLILENVARNTPMMPWICLTLL